MSKLLSIVLPTFNRGYMIEYTLEILNEQIERNSSEVELVVCNNASTDDTSDIVSRFVETHPCVKFVNYTDHVEIGVSITRSVDNATGKYALLWGDDDIPSPFLVDILLYYIKANPDIGIIHFNGMTGMDQDDFKMKNVNVMNKSFDRMTILYDLEKFAETHYSGMGLMSSDMFLLEAWKKGRKLDSSTHYGYEFVAPILIGAKGHKCLYINFPLWIQRIPMYRAWQSRATQFWYIGIPNLLKDLEKNNVIKDWRSTWNKANTKRLLIHVIPQMLLDKKMYKSLLPIIKENQNSWQKKLFVDFCYYFVPSSLYKFVRKRHFKK